MDKRWEFEDVQAGLALATEPDRTPIVAGRFGRRNQVFDLKSTEFGANPQSEGSWRFYAPSV
jgi:hypothetical protein